MLRIVEMHRVAIALLATIVSGCDSPLPITHETEHLRIGTDIHVCQGNLHSFERAVLFAEDDLGLELPPTITVYLWRQTSWEARGVDACRVWDHAFGCYDYNESTVHATTFSIYHELTHAAVSNPDLDVFFSEGIADAYGQRVLPFGATAPSANAHVSRENYDRATASHFSRWLREKWGGNKLGQLATLSGSGFDNFESVYGISLQAAEVMYFAEAPSIYPPLRNCDAPEMSERNSGEGWRAEIDFDCGRNHTFAWETGLAARRTLVVHDDGRYSFATDGAFFSAFRCAEGAIEEYLGDDALSAEDIPAEYASYPSPGSRFFEGGEIHTVDLRRGRYDLSVAVEGFEPSTATIAVWPSLSPGPVEAGEP